MRRPSAYPGDVVEIEVIQTHASVVFLTRDLAYKVKKPVDFGFLDYSTLPRRLEMCRAEVELNRRLAPDVYLGVVPIVAERDGVRVQGDGDAIEYAVKMRRLPDEARLGCRLRAGEVDPQRLDELAQRLSRFHAEAHRGPEVAQMARYEVVQGNCEENFEQLRDTVARAVSQPVYDRLVASTRAELERRRALIEQRAATSVACETHGDLRLEHIYLFSDREPPRDISIVDCIEFNERFRHADPIADVAFLIMDMRAHGHRDAAQRLLEAYAVHSGDRDGTSLFPLYIAYRATVRGKVRAMQAAEPEIPEPERRQALQVARGHLVQALGELSVPAERPCVLLMCGLPGTGKSVLAQALADAAGFAVIRSDVTRKKLAGLPDGASAGTTPEAGIYGADWTQRTYDACEVEAEASLFEGRRVIVDATFRNEGQRLQFLDMAQRWFVPLRIVHCVAPPDVVHERLDRRQGDPSDADWGVYQHMTTIWEPFGSRTADVVDTVQTGGSTQDVRDRALQALRQHDLA